MPVGVINVSNRLPVTVEPEKITKSSGGLVAALEGLSEKEYRSQWIGWPGAAFDEAKRRKEVERILTEQYAEFGHLHGEPTKLVDFALYAGVLPKQLVSLTSVAGREE